MAYERKLAAVSPQAFTANGTAQGLVTIESTVGFYIKQFVNLQSDTLQSAGFQVKNILSQTQMIIGLPNNSLKAPLNPLDLSGYLVADAATISAPEQDNFPIKPDDHYLSIYMPAPVSSDRVIGIDPYGNPWSQNNPMPVEFDGTISIGDVTVVGTAPNHYPLEPNSDGSIDTISLAQLVPYKFDEIDLTNSTIDGQVVPTTVVYKQMGSTVATLTLTYDGQANLLSVVRSPA